VSGDRPIDMRVGFSNDDAARAITHYLIDRGCRRIAYVGRPTAGNDRAHARRSGFLAAIADRGLALDPAYLIETETSVSTGADTVRTLRRLPAPPEAVLFS
jgi:LacI family transcriptional regulator, gluconate utilization system Gnt-I transcriptional repressor